MVVQFQDPEFDNELCNLSSMSELPKDKVTLKVYSKNPESYHTDSTLHSASLTASSEDIPSPTTSHPCQLPQAFNIPTFSFDVELKLKQGNEAWPEVHKLSLRVEPFLTSPKTQYQTFWIN
ncbi:hypothetical protein F2P81_007554 [Scophthalmus maximus]|uniref:Uncharacterized protein n=1 Tax=Scophthalmus maximus TaxID=52904 RepID=A0A6A4T368_SCOMX|nr:hypothetical protein F2P81_007554 [Scophthalmus maximus]